MYNTDTTKKKFILTFLPLFFSCPTIRVSRIIGEKF